VAIWSANVVRIAALIVVGNRISPEVATRGFHSQVGWIAFLAVALGLVLMTQSCRFFRANHTLTEHQEANGTVMYLLPFFAILATAMITGAFSADDALDWFYPLRVVVAAMALWLFAHSWVTDRWSWSWTAVFLGAAVFLLWLALEPLTSDRGRGVALADSLSGLPVGWAAAWLIFRVIGFTITVPLAEELAFRGYIMRRLIATRFEEVPFGQFSWLSLLVSSALFGVMHSHWLAGMVAGLCYATALYRRGRLTECVIAHATTNAMLAAYALATGSWSLLA
jgi:exosortase E/protease (VPEID-CTERM system)